MPKEMILEYLALNKEEDNLRLRLVMQTAPLLKGIKYSCILVVKHADWKLVRQELAHTDIVCEVLHKSRNKHVIFLYRRNAINEHLQQDTVRNFLLQFGYQGRFLEDFLPLLKKRMGCFYENNESFPHEIGIFLGYPMEDIEGFIANEGRNYLLCGYWKVYSDLSRAKKIFRKFDDAKDKATRELLAGKTLCEIAG